MRELKEMNLYISEYLLELRETGTVCRTSHQFITSGKKMTNDVFYQTSARYIYINLYSNQNNVHIN